MTIEFKYDFGDKVTHTVSGATGVVAGVSLCKYAAEMYLIQPKCNADGSFQQPTWMNEGELERAM